jgi:hypothetical protein
MNYRKMLDKFYFLFSKTWIYHKNNAIYSERSFSDICGYNAFSARKVFFIRCRRVIEYPLLLLPKNIRNFSKKFEKIIKKIKIFTVKGKNIGE